MMKIAYIDHYDSFSFNLIDWLERDPEIHVHRIAYDDPIAMANLMGNPCPMVLSPGPKSPIDAPQTLKLIQSSLGNVPILGVCLGHQMLAYVGGASIVRSQFPRHGATRSIRVLSKTSLFTGAKDKFPAAAYNSLTVDEKSLLNGDFAVLARCENNEIQAVRLGVSEKFDAYGVQYHPESYLSEDQDVLRNNWIDQARTYYDLR